MDTLNPQVLKTDSGARLALDVIADTWTPLVIYVLGKKIMRTSDIKSTIPGISQKMLTQTLRKLEHYGLVGRKVFPEVPPRVEYSLTEMGHSLRDPLRTLCHWGQDHKAALQEAKRKLVPKARRA